MGSLTVPLPPCGTDECAAVISDLGRAVTSRDVIGMAKGVLMQRRQVSADEAFAILVTESQHQNRKLRVIAAEIVAGFGAAAPRGYLSEPRGEASQALPV